MLTIKRSENLYDVEEENFSKQLHKFYVSKILRHENPIGSPTFFKVKAMIMVDFT